MAYCGDCGHEITGSLTEHYHVCPARTCDMCDTVYDRPVPENDAGERVCQACRRQDDAQMAYDADEDGNGEGTD